MATWVIRCLLTEGHDRKYPPPPPPPPWLVSQFAPPYYSTSPPLDELCRYASAIASQRSEKGLIRV